MNKDLKDFISIIIPCFNEEESLPYLKEHLDELLQKAPFSIQFIFVDDGSKDRTLSLLQELFSHYPLVTIIHNERNLNLGGVIRKSLSAVKGEWVAVIDADCSYSPLHLIPMWEQLKRESYDVIDASAHHPQAGFSRDTPCYRVLLSRGVVFIYNFILGERQYCYTSMFRLYRGRDLLELDLKKEGFLVMAEIKVKLLLNRKKFLEYPATNRFRKFGVSKMRILRNIVHHLIFMGQLILYRTMGLKRP